MYPATTTRVTHHQLKVFSLRVEDFLRCLTVVAARSTCSTAPKARQPIAISPRRAHQGGRLGNGGADISDFGRTRLPQYGPNFNKMAKPALVVCGDEDVNPQFTHRGADWHADSYALAPGPKDLLALKGAKHGLGGISGWDAGETLDESPERLAVVQRMTWAYLRSRLYAGDGAWAKACKAFKGLEGQGKVESKG